MPRAGTWVLTTSQTMTVSGPGGPGGTGSFQLQVGGCGSQLNLTNFGSAESGVHKTFIGSSIAGAYVYATHVQRLPLVITMTFTDPEHMQGQWEIPGFSVSPALAYFVEEDGEVSAAGDPRCGCGPFEAQLRERIAENEARIFDLSYSERAVRPEGLDPGIEWTTGIMQRLDALMNPEGAFGWMGAEDAVQEINQEVARGELLDELGAVYDPDTYEAGYMRGLDCEDCRVGDPTPVAGCAGDVLTEAEGARLASLAETCETVKHDAEMGAPLGTRLAFCAEQRKPARFLEQSIAALEAENAAIRAGYQDLCFGAL